MKNNRQVGCEGEQIAYDYLKSKGYIILDRNYSCKLGEIDIVAMDKDVVVFVEVKARQNTRFGMPYEAVTKAKMRNIVAVAKLYMLTHKIYDQDVRFDIISILREDIQHIENAFDGNCQ